MEYTVSITSTWLKFTLTKPFFQFRSVVGDFDGNGHDDMLCHDPNTGNVEIHYSHRNSFQPLTWSRDIDWCLESNSELFAGDFNGDKKSDLLCHHNNGFKDYAFANAEGVFSGT